MDSAARASVQPAPAPCRTVTSPASRRSARLRRITTGFVATLVAIWSEVTTSRPRSCTRAIQVSTWTATVILLLALTSSTPLL